MASQPEACRPPLKPEEVALTDTTWARGAREDLCGASIHVVGWDSRVLHDPCRTDFGTSYAATPHYGRSGLDTTLAWPRIPLPGWPDGDELGRGGIRAVDMLAASAARGRLTSWPRCSTRTRPCRRRHDG